MRMAAVIFDQLLWPIAAFKRTVGCLIYSVQSRVMYSKPDDFISAYGKKFLLFTSFKYTLSSIQMRKIGPRINKCSQSEQLKVLFSSVPSKVRNLRKMRNYGQNFSSFAQCYNDLRAN